MNDYTEEERRLAEVMTKVLGGERCAFDADEARRLIAAGVKPPARGMRHFVETDDEKSGLWVSANCTDDGQRVYLREIGPNRVSEPTQREKDRAELARLRKEYEGLKETSDFARLLAIIDRMMAGYP